MPESLINSNGLSWRDVPIPRRMRALGRDRRGYPIPFIVFRDQAGRPHFTINDSDRLRRCLLEDRCGICGNRLEQPRWFVGGPMSAFHENGAYLDSPLHHDCMTYALQVCPYLAVKNYQGRIDDATVDYDKVPNHLLFMDPTVMEGRPGLFVAVASNSQTVIERESSVAPVIKPGRPYIAIEYWRNGERLPQEEGQMSAALAVFGETTCQR